MVRALFSFSGMMIAFQLVAVGASLAVILLYPPRQGQMMLVPVWPGAEREMAAHAIDAGALLVARGPLPHSLIVSGARAAIAPVLLRTGVLTLASSVAPCGSRT